MTVTRPVITTFLVFMTTCVGYAAPVLSETPFIYVINYGDRWIHEPDRAGYFGDYPPDVLHIGKAVPVTQHWGPIPYMAGENQATGSVDGTLNREAIRLLSPDELEQKITAITAAVQRLHAAGIPRVMPYICFFTMAGDHENREGLWAFYDRWDEYSRWLGPRPPTDPTDWMWKDVAGNRIDPSYGFSPPYYAPLHRYGACPNNPGWNRFSQAIVRLIAECGYDGVFVDNATVGHCGCRHCQEHFTSWLVEHFSEATIQRICGDDIGEISLENQTLQPLRARFQVTVIRDRLAMLRDIGREINPDFRIFPNGGSFQRAIAVGDGCDFYMFESIHPSGLLMDSEPPLHPEALVTVADGAPVEMANLNYEVNHTELRVEVMAAISYPRVSSPGQPVNVAVNVLRVGVSDTDDDYMQDLSLHFVHLESGERDSVMLTPQLTIGLETAAPGAQRPPVQLGGEWTPHRTGAYAIDVVYRYTDLGHPAVADNILVSDRLGLGNIYRVNLGGLAATYNSRSKMVGLSYTHTQSGWEAVQELAIAEGAAAGGRFAVESSGEPHNKYRRFFHQYGQRGAGLEPYGDISLLFAYWGDNPGHIGLESTPRTIAEYLSTEHILYRSLLDRNLELSDISPAAGKTLILVAGNYELSEQQIDLLRDFVRHGGRLIVENPDMRINFLPHADVLGDAADKVLTWDWHNPQEIGPAMLSSMGRLRGVRFTAFCEPGPATRRIVLHAVNYNVTALAANPGIVTPMNDLTLRLPVPRDWAAAGVVVYDPDREEPLEAACEVQDGIAVLTLPPLRIYQMVELTAL